MPTIAYLLLSRSNLLASNLLADTVVGVSDLKRNFVFLILAQILKFLILERIPNIHAYSRQISTISYQFNI